MASITLRDLVKAYGDVEVLHHVEGAINDGEFIVEDPEDRVCIIANHTARGISGIVTEPCDLFLTDRALKAEAEAEARRDYTQDDSSLHSQLSKFGYFFY